MTSSNLGFATAFSRDPTELKSALTLYELKQKAMAFYAHNGVLSRMEDVVNGMFYDQPNDIYGHLANYFEQWQLPPTISKLKARRVFDSQGTQTIQVDVFAIVKNDEKHITTLTYSSETAAFDHAKAEEVALEDSARCENILRAVELVSTSFSPAVKGVTAYDQATLDSKLLDQFAQDTTEQQDAIDAERHALLVADAQSAASANSEYEVKPQKKGAEKGKRSGKKDIVIIKDEPREQLPVGYQALGVASFAVCMAGAKLLHLPLYEHLANYASELGANTRADEREGARKFRMPLPICTLLYSGKAAAGKQKLIKEYAITPRWGLVLPPTPSTRGGSGAIKPGSEPPLETAEPWIVYPRANYEKTLFDLTAVQTQLLRNMQVKQGPPARYVNEFGAFCPLFDKLEQGLDLITEALTQKELKDKFGIVLNCAAHEIFDYDKGKYEIVTGTLKTGEELVDMYAELVTKNPMVVGLIDPFRKVERANWLKLAEKVGQQCFLVGDYCYNASWRQLKQAPIGQYQEASVNFDFTNAASLHVNSRNTVSDVMNMVQTLRTTNNAVIVSSNKADSAEAYEIDLAVAIGAEFVRVGAPTRGERTTKLNRILQILQELDLAGRLRSDDSEAQVIKMNKLFAIQEQERLLAQAEAEAEQAQAEAEAAAAAAATAAEQQNA